MPDPVIAARASKLGLFEATMIVVAHYQHSSAQIEHRGTLFESHPLRPTVSDRHDRDPT
jgi:hypothetical protein